MGFGEQLCTNLQNGLAVWLSALGAYVLVRELSELAYHAALRRRLRSVAPLADASVVVVGSDALKAEAPTKDVETAAAAPLAEGADPNSAEKGSAGLKPVVSSAEVAVKLTELWWFVAASAVVALAALFGGLVAYGVLGGAPPPEMALAGPSASGGSLLAAGSVPLPPSPSPPPTPPVPPPPPTPPPRPPPIMRPSPPPAPCPLTAASDLAKLGDGWCDTAAPFNTRDCGYDGGDCCNTSLPIFDCINPASPFFGQSSPLGLHLPAPTNPRYATGGRPNSALSLVTSYNNYYGELSASSRLIFTPLS